MALMSFQDYQRKLGRDPSAPVTPGYRQYLFNQSGGSQGQDFGVQADPSGSGRLVSKQTGNIITDSSWSTNQKAALGNPSVSPGSLASMGGQGVPGVGIPGGPSLGMGSVVRLGGAQPIRWKPFSEKDGRLVVLANTAAPFSLVNRAGQVLSVGRNEGPSNGYLSTVRFDRPGSGYGQDVFLRIGNSTFQVPNPAANYKALPAVQLSPAQQAAPSRGPQTMAQPGSLAAMSGVPQKLDPYDRASVDRYLQASPNLPGQNIGGNYYPNPYYDPSVRSGTQTTMNYGRGGTDIGRGGEGPFYYRAASAAPFQGQSAPQMAPAMGGGAVLAPPSGGGGGEMPSPGDFTKDIGEPPGPYTPQQVDLDVATDTTRGVLYNMLRTDSSYINEARTRAMEAASRRGLSNSSIAAGAGERAAVQSAGPIAQSTAEANLQTKMFNVDATNRARALQFQEANANWRTRQSIALGYYQVEAANARLDKQIAADLNMQQQSFAFAIEQWRLSNLSQVNTMGGVTADQQATASSRINATAAGSPYAINARAATEQQWLNNWSRWA